MMCQRPPPRPLASPAAKSSSHHQSQSTTGGQYATPGAGRLAMSHLASPSPAGANGGRSVPATALRSPPPRVQTSGLASVSMPQHGDEAYVWSPSRGPVSPRAADSYAAGGAPAASTTSTHTSTLRHTTTSYTTGSQATPLRSPRQNLRSPTRGTAPQSQTTRAAPQPQQQQPVSSLLDSMSELRALIAKKEMELTSLAHTRASTTASAAASLATTTPYQPLSPRLGGYAAASPMASPSPSPPVFTSTFQSSPSTTAMLAQTQQAPQQGVSSHVQSLHDQEVHEYSVRIASLEQIVMEREEQYQSLKLEADRLKRREETLSADGDVRAAAHKKQVELLSQNLESLTWNRHDSLEKQREEFERLRKEMMEELVKKEEIHNLKLQNLNQNLLNYEEQLRSHQQALEETRTGARKEADNSSSTIASLTLEVESLKNQKASAKDQLQSGVKQQLSMTSNLKTLSRKLEETQRKQESERAEFLTLRSRMEQETARLRAELEARAEDLVSNLRAVENQLLENERNHAHALANVEQHNEELIIAHAADRERLLEDAHETKRSLVDEFQAKVNESALALTTAQNRIQHLERDLQDQRQRMQHEQALTQESWNNLVLEKEREIQTTKRECLQLQQQFAALRDGNAELDAQGSNLRIELVQTQADLQHARQSLEESQSRLAEARVAHKAADDEKTNGFHARVDDLQARLVKSERESDDNARALQVERLRTSELSSQLQLMRTSSQTKVRAIEVARSLEQQALLTDFASQLGRVRSEITAIKTQTPKDKQREWNRAKRDRERDRQANERETSRERSRERMRSPQPQSAIALGLSPMGSARRHVRVRSIDDTPLHAPQIFGSPRA